MPTTNKKYEKGSPMVKIAKFVSGNPKNDYDVKLRLVSTMKVQMRHNSIEAARVAAHKIIANEEETYFLEVKVYPHCILRENKMIATAGADRLQEGMRKAYGKPTSLAARVKIGESVLDLSVMNERLATAEAAFKTAASKLPAPMRIEKVMLNPKL